MTKYTIRDWAGNNMGFGNFNSFDDAWAALDTWCTEKTQRENPDLDILSDDFCDLVDVEQEEYQVVEVE